jgi:hypothetical protein
VGMRIYVGGGGGGGVGVGCAELVLLWYNIA